MKIRNIRATPPPNLSKPHEIFRSGIVSELKSWWGDAVWPLEHFFCVEKSRKNKFETNKPPPRPYQTPPEILWRARCRGQNTTALLKWKIKIRATALGPHQTPQEILRRYIYAVAV